MQVLYWSCDSGQLYLPQDIDGAYQSGAGLVVPVSNEFIRYEVPDTIVFTPEQLCVQDGNILEALLRSGQARQL